MTRAAIAMLVGLVFLGCDGPNRSKEAIELGDKRVKLNAFHEAVRAYESALDGTPKTAEAHFKLGNLYDDKLKSPLSAIHHYDRYLELSPEGSRAKDARMGKADCERRLNLTMKDGGLMTTAEATRLRNENEGLRKALTEIRNPKPTPTPRVPNPTEPDRPLPGARKHVVAKGDTLASIAFKYYRNRSQVSHIKNANFNQLAGKDVIKPGMTLIIPELPARKSP